MIKHKIFIALTSMGYLCAEEAFLPEKCCPIAKREVIAFLPNEVGFKTYGEFLYWKTSTDPLPYATTFFNQPVVPPLFSAGTIPNKIEFQSCEFGYGPGFRVGGSYAFACDLWDVAFTWTQLDQNAHDTISVVGKDLSLNTLWGLTLSTPSMASANQKERFINLDFEIGRTWYITQHFFIRGDIAPELAWMTEELAMTYTAIPIEEAPAHSNSFVVNKNQFHGVGASVGIKSNYYMGYGFSLYGTGKIAVYAANITLTCDETLTNIEDISPFTTQTMQLTRKNVIHNMNANYVVNLGLEWGKDLYAKALGISVSLGYEFNYWPNNIQFIQIANETTTQPLILNQFSDVSFQGLTARASLYF